MQMPQAHEEASVTRRLIIIREIIVVLVLTFVPSMFNVFRWMGSEEESRVPLEIAALAYFVQALQETVPLLYIMSQSGRGWQYYGITIPRVSDIPLAALLICVCVLTAFALSLFIRGAGGQTDLGSERLPRGALAYWILASASISLGEELSMRAYLLPRLKELLGSYWKAILLSTLLFAMYHIHRGPFGLANAFVSGIVFATVFCLIRRVWPLVVAHFAWDLFAFVIHSS